MAEGEDAGWWRSWLQQSYQAVKEKSTEALEFMKRDLAEFTQVVQHDTACTIAATASVVKDKLAVSIGKTEGPSGATEKVRKGISDFLGVISDTFAPSPDKTIDCDVITLMATPTGTTEPYDSAKARLYSLQSDPATYCTVLKLHWGFSSCCCGVRFNNPGFPVVLKRKDSSVQLLWEEKRIQFGGNLS